MKKTIEQILEEVSAWSETTFPGDGIEDMLRKLDEEHRELSEAVSTYLGPWSDLDGEFSPSRAAAVGDMRRLDLLDEIADNVFVLVRIAHVLGSDFREVLQNKWDIVRARDYSRQLEPKDGSNDDRPMIDRLSNDDSRFVIVWNVGRGFYLVDGDGSGRGRSLSHWTSNAKAATKFREEDARFWLLEGRLIDERGEEYRLADIGPLLVREVEPDDKGQGKLFRGGDV